MTGQHRRRISAIYWLEVSRALALGATLVTAAIGTPTARAQTYTVLHRFRGGADGANPLAGLIRDSAGNLYGTTLDGGAPSTVGVVFKLDMTGETVLYSFRGGTDGSSPVGGLIRDSAGNLYGTSDGGGTFNGGVAFKLDTSGTETVLYSFTGGADGNGSIAGWSKTRQEIFTALVTRRHIQRRSSVQARSDRHGDVLYSFVGAAGETPTAGLIRDSAGNLYGTTMYGGIVGCLASCGVVFKLDAMGAETVLYRFTGGTDGANPYAGLIRDSAGNLYGTTLYGGTSNAGVVFKLDATGTETVLHNFTGGVDGGNPYAGLIRDSAGNLYGTTFFGGNINTPACGIGTPGCGVVFKLDKAGRETVLHRFTGGADRANPFAGVIRDAAGNLYDTTSSGGSSAYSGIVFRLKL